jgi:hypothetical protein
MESGMANGKNGTLVVTRDGAAGRDMLRSYDVWADKAKVASVKRGKSARIDLPAGKHVIQVRIDWNGSKELTVVIAEGVEIELTCGPNKSGKGALHDAVGAKDTYLWLRPRGA